MRGLWRGISGLFKYAGMVSTIRDLPWYWQGIQWGVAVALAAISSAQGFIAELPIIPRIVLLFGVLIGAAGLMGLLINGGRRLLAKSRSSQGGEIGRSGGITLHIGHVENLQIPGVSHAEGSITPQQAVVPQVEQKQPLTPSGHPVPQPLPPDALSTSTLKGLSFLITELDSGSRLIENRTFEDCFIHGPAVLLLARSDIYDADMSPRDPEPLFWDMGNRRTVTGIIAVRNCVFRRCTFVGIGFAGPPSEIQRWRDTLLAYNAAQEHGGR